jgi:hypothetical protein
MARKKRKREMAKGERFSRGERAMSKERNLFFEGIMVIGNNF